MLEIAAALVKQGRYSQHSGALQPRPNQVVKGPLSSMLEALPIGKARPGQLVMVVGPSGAGKDTLIDYARSRSIADARISFVRRFVTRAPGIGEENVSMTEAAFAAALTANAFALAWRSHGLAYAVPASIRDDIAAGKVVVVNVSRTALAQAAGVAEHRTVVEITAPPEILMSRLRARQREGAEDIEARLARQVPVDPAGASHEKIDNGGDMARAGEQFLVLLRRLASEMPREI